MLALKKQKDSYLTKLNKEKKFFERKKEVINFNNQNITKNKTNNKKYRNNFINSLNEQILSPLGNEDIPFSGKNIFTYNKDYTASFINESDININLLRYNNNQKKTLILDLDETLVHSSFRPIIYNGITYPPDIFLTINFHNKYHNIYVLKRPYVDEFIKEMNKIYNIIIFTASVKEYANPLLDILDKEKIIKKRFFREHCTFNDGKFIKNLDVIGQDLKELILLDNNPISYSLNKKNGLPIKSWYYDKDDRELINITDILNFLANVNDVREYIPNIFNTPENNTNNKVITLNNEYEQNKIIRPKAKSQNKYLFNTNNMNNNEEFKKVKIELDNYNYMNFSNNIKTKNLKKELRNKIHTSIVQFKNQIELLQNKYNNINILSNNYLINEKKNISPKEKINNINVHIPYNFYLEETKNIENNKKIKDILNLDKKLNFDYFTPKMTDKFSNKFNDYNDCQNKNINENYKNRNLYYDTNRHNSPYKISKKTNDYIKKRMKFRKYISTISEEEKLYS